MGLIIEGEPKDEIACKRLYLSGVKATSNCPKCGQKTVLDLGKDYLSYPMMNAKTALHFYCNECNTEWDESATLSVTLKA